MLVAAFRTVLLLVNQTVGAPFGTTLLDAYLSVDANWQAFPFDFFVCDSRYTCSQWSSMAINGCFIGMSDLITKKEPTHLQSLTSIYT
jgi:hypothetical protein